MGEFRRGSHTVYKLQYHVVWVTKYRYHVLQSRRWKLDARVELIWELIPLGLAEVGRMLDEEVEWLAGALAAEASEGLPAALSQTRHRDMRWLGLARYLPGRVQDGTRPHTDGRIHEEEPGWTGV